MNQASNSGKGLAAGLGTAFKGIVTGAAAVHGSVIAVGAGLSVLEKSTREYRENQAMTTTAMEEAGFTAQQATEQYQAFYGILGDGDTATEATQLLSKLATTQEDLGTWTTITTGILSEFGDALPIEGLIESANETARVGVVTGNLADALNWVGVSEDEFNAKLEQLSTTEERNALITETLNELYADSAEAYRENNAEIIKANELQAKQEDIMARVGEKVLSIKNNITTALLPATEQMVDTTIRVLDEMEAAYEEKGVRGIVEKISEVASQSVTQFVEKIPAMAETGASMLESMGTAIVDSIPGLLSKGGEVMTQFLGYVGEKIPELIGKFFDFQAGIDQLITDNADGFLDAGFELIEKVISGIVGGYSTIFGEGSGIVDAFVDGLLSRAETLGTTATSFISKLSQFLTENVPILVENGTQMVKGFVDGIVEKIPGLLDTAIELVMGLGGFIVDNLPTIISTGGKILFALIDGILDGIWYAIQNIPTIVSTIISTIVEKLPDILDTGKTLLLELIAGIAEVIPDLASQAGEIGDTILQKLGELPGLVFETGVNIVTGIWEGITSMAGWVLDNVGGFVADIMGIFTGSDGFDTHSPSKWSESIMQYVMQGMEIGIDKNGDAVVKSAEQISSDIMDGLTKWVDDKKYYNEISLKEELAYWNDVSKIQHLAAEEQEEIRKEIYRVEQEIAAEEQRLLESQQAEMERVLQEQEQAYNDYVAGIESRSSQLAGTFDIFGQIQEQEAVIGDDLIKGLDDQVQQFKDWQENLATLAERGISTELLEELQQKGPTVAAEVKALTTLDDEGLQEYANLYAESLSLAAGQALAEAQSVAVASPVIASTEAPVTGDYQTMTPIASSSGTPLTTEAVLQTLLAGFAGVATAIFDAIPKQQTMTINGYEVARATWDDFVEYAKSRGGIFAPTEQEIADIALRAMPS